MRVMEVRLTTLYFSRTYLSVTKSSITMRTRVIYLRGPAQWLKSRNREFRTRNASISASRALLFLRTGGIVELILLARWILRQRDRDLENSARGSGNRPSPHALFCQGTRLPSFPCA